MNSIINRRSKFLSPSHKKQKILKPKNAHLFFATRPLCTIKPLHNEPNLFRKFPTDFLRKPVPGPQVLLFSEKLEKILVPKKSGQTAKKPSPLFPMKTTSISDPLPLNKMVGLGFNSHNSYFASRVPKDNFEHLPFLEDFQPQDHEWMGHRKLMPSLSILENQLIAQAKFLLDFQRTHSFCSQCGDPHLTPHNLGHALYCSQCNTTHFPRTDPCVIMLVHDVTKENVLLARQSSWEKKRYSCLAGFLEAGENIQEAVRREVWEEVGIEIEDEVHFFGSQSWPFPRNLMIGCYAQAKSKAIHIDPEEIEDALWYSCREVVDVLEGTSTLFGLPGPESISHRLISNFCRTHKSR